MLLGKVAKAKFGGAEIEWQDNEGEKRTLLVPDTEFDAQEITRLTKLLVANVSDEMTFLDPRGQVLGIVKEWIGIEELLISWWREQSEYKGDVSIEKILKAARRKNDVDLNVFGQVSELKKLRNSLMHSDGAVITYEETLRYRKLKDRLWAELYPEKTLKPIFDN